MARTISVAIVGDATSLERSFKRAGDASDGFGKKMGVSMKGLAKAGAVGAAAGGVALVTKQLFSSVNAAKEAEKAQVRLDQAFKASGVSQANAAKAQAKISAVSKKAALDDEDLSDVLAMLTRSTGSVKKGMEGMALASEIARGRNVSLAVAAKAVEKAHLGSDTALKRLGVSVPKVSVRYDALKEKIKGLQERLKGAKGPLRDVLEEQIEGAKAGLKRAAALDKEEAAQNSLAKATKLFAGSSEAYGKTAAGAQEKLSVAFENLQEKVGAKLLPVLTRLTLKLVEFVDWSEKNWPRFAAAAQDAYARMKPVIDNMLARLRDIGNVFRGVVKVIQGIANGEWSEVWKGVKIVAKAQLNLLYHTALELPKKIITTLGRKAWDGLKAVGGYIGDAITAGLQAVLQRAAKLIDEFTGKIDVVGGAINKVVPGNPVPKIPKIGDVGPKKAAGKPARVGSDSADASRRLSVSSGGRSTVAGGVTIQNVTLPGVTNPTQFLQQLQRIANSQATPRRGRYGGANLGTG